MFEKVLPEKAEAQKVEAVEQSETSARRRMSAKGRGI